MGPVQAAFRGAREIGFTVLSMSTSLVAVFIPILLMQGLVGRLFREHNRSLVSYLAMRLRSVQEAKEVAQEAYVRVLQLQEPGAVSFLRAYLFKEVHEFVGAKSIGLDDAAPVGIERYGALGANTLAPVVFVGKAAAGPADVGDMQRLKGGDDIVADAPGIGDGGIGADPDAFVDAVAEMFGKLAEEVAVNFGSRMGCVNGELNRLSEEGRHHCRHKERKATE